MIRKSFKFVFGVVGRFLDNRCTIHAAGLTYYAILSLVPILCVILIAAKTFGAQEFAKEKIRAWMDSRIESMEKGPEEMSAITAVLPGKSSEDEEKKPEDAEKGAAADKQPSAADKQPAPEKAPAADAAPAAPAPSGDAAQGAAPGQPAAASEADAAEREKAAALAKLDSDKAKALENVVSQAKSVESHVLSAIDAIEPAVRSVSDVRHRVRLIRDYSDRTYSPLEVLREISILLPDGITLVEMRYKREETRVTVKATATSTELAYAFKQRVDGSPLFSESKFTSGPTTNARTGGADFELTILLAAPQPEEGGTP